VSAFSIASSNAGLQDKKRYWIIFFVSEQDV
jgi:hypothetical protein